MMDHDLIDTADLNITPADIARGEREEGYARLLDCYKSGHITEAEWTEHLLDDDFLCWYESLGR